MSSEAPVVILPKKSSSAIRPPRATVIMSQSYSFVYNETSSGRYCAKPKDPLALGMIVNFNSGAAFFEYHPATACPDS